MSFHSFGQKIILPWAYTKERSEDYAELYRKGREMAAAIENSTSTIYKVGISWDTLNYTSTGTQLRTNLYRSPAAEIEKGRRGSIIGRRILANIFYLNFLFACSLKCLTLSLIMDLKLNRCGCTQIIIKQKSKRKLFRCWSVGGTYFFFQKGGL